MDLHILGTAGKYAGLAGIALIVFLWLFRTLLKLPALQRTIKVDQVYQTITLLIKCVSLVTIVSIICWAAVAILRKDGPPAGSFKVVVAPTAEVWYQKSGLFGMRVHLLFDNRDPYQTASVTGASIVLKPTHGGSQFEQNWTAFYPEAGPVIGPDTVIIGPAAAVSKIVQFNQLATNDNGSAWLLQTDDYRWSLRFSTPRGDISTAGTFSVTDSTAKQLLDRKQIHDNTWSTVTLVTQTGP